MEPAYIYPLKKALEACGVDMDEFSKYSNLEGTPAEGVDTLITLDLVRLAQRRAYDTALLVAGDRDLAEPVRVAQDEGRQLVLALPEGADAARKLKQLADSVILLDSTTLGRWFAFKDASWPATGTGGE